jgi:hypothetical protein
MSCVLRIAGRDLDVDKLIEKMPLPGMIKQYKSKQYIAGDIPNGTNYSFISIPVSEANLDSVNKQISETITFLDKYSSHLMTIDSFSGIEYAVLHFLVQVESMSKSHFDQKIYFQKELMKLCGKLGIGIEVALVDGY